MGLPADTAVELLLTGKVPVSVFAITAPTNDVLLSKLYKALSTCRQQKFVFVLTNTKMLMENIDGIARFFFLTNYFFKGNSPQLVCRGEIAEDIKAALNDWCAKQKFDEIRFLLAETFLEKNLDLGDFIYVTPEQRESFLSFLLNKFVKLEWLARKIIFQVDDKKAAHDLMRALYKIIKLLEKDHASVYAVYTTLATLENELRKNETIIRYQEIEINNQKLYNNLIRGGAEPKNITISSISHHDQSETDINKLRDDYNKLCLEVGRLRNEIAWYKRTYEERSLMGTIKEKLLRNLRQH